MSYPNDLSSQYGGKWAVVTGATEVIGQSYARKLAQRKMNILLICKNKDKLHKVAEEINLDYQVETKYISIDLVNLTHDNYSYIESMLNEIDIGILVNNAGANDINLLASLGRKSNQYLIDYNIKTTVLMSHMVLPQMIKRKAGAIVTISSLAPSLPLPYMILYSASKLFIDSFSKLLQTENAAHNIFIQTVQPGLINTPSLQSPFLGRFFIVDPDTYCESAVRTLGLSHKTHGYWKHGLVGYLNKFFKVFLTY